MKITFKASEPVGPGIVIPGEVHRVRDVFGRVGEERAAGQLCLQPIDLQVVDL